MTERGWSCNCDSTNPHMGPWHAVGCCALFAPAAEPRSLTVRYGLPRWMVRQHLEAKGVEFTEDKQPFESTFRVSASVQEWEAINRVVQEAGG